MRTTRWQGIATASGLAAQAWADRAHRLGTADRARDLGVGRGRPDGNGPQRLPHLLLKGGAADVERQIEVLPGRLDEADDLGDGPLEIRRLPPTSLARGKRSSQIRARARPDRRRA